MSIDKTWTTMPPNCEEFWKGLDSFVERAESYIDSRGQIRCPCRRCLNYNFMDIPTMKNHISRFGFCQRYVTWVYHGESRTPPIVNDVAPSSRYRGHKSKFKTHFLKKGGYEDVERARANPPAGMSEENWNKAVDFYATEKHKKRSDQNKVNKAKQVITNRGGTSSYSSSCHKHNKSKVQGFHFDNPRSEEQYNALLHELSLQTQLSTSSNNPTSVDEATVFEKVLGSRRGHIKGIGHKPSGTASSAQSGISRPTQPNQLDVMLRNPAFREAMEAAITNVMQSFLTQNNNLENDANEDDTNEDDNRDE